LLIFINFYVKQINLMLYNQ